MWPGRWGSTDHARLRARASDPPLFSTQLPRHCPCLLQSDQDAYACSGQKCSAQSILFMHNNWAEAGACRSQQRWLALRVVCAVVAPASWSVLPHLMIQGAPNPVDLSG